MKILPEGLTPTVTVEDSFVQDRLPTYTTVHFQCSILRHPVNVQ